MANDGRARDLASEAELGARALDLVSEHLLRSRLGLGEERDTLGQEGIVSDVDEFNGCATLGRACEAPLQGSAAVI